MSSNLFDNPRRKNLRITDDFVFKYMYGEDTPESKKALMDILNVILERNENPIVDIFVKSPINNRKSRIDKESIMDIRAETDSGELLDIEMQNGNLEHYADRSVYYTGELIDDSLQAGELYDKMRPVIIISIVNGRFMPNNVKFHSKFYFLDEDSGYVLSKKAQIHFIELGKVNTDKAVLDMSTLERLAVYFKYACSERHGDYIEKIISETKEVAMSELRLRTLTEDEIQYEEARAKRLWKLNHDSELNAAKKKGIEEGKIEIALNMKNRGMEKTVISEITGLTIEEIENL